MKLHKRKLLFFIFIMIALILVNHFISSSAKEFISTRRQEFALIKQAEEQANVSSVSVCTSDGQSLSKQEGASYYLVPKEMERIYICGTLENSDHEVLTIYLSQGGDAFTSKTDVLQKGPFIMDVLSTDALKGGMCQADLYIVRDMPTVSVSFRIEK